MCLQVLELPSKTDKIVDFAWEPKGTRFAVLHGDGSRPNLSLYEMRDMRTTARGVQLVATQPGKQVNSIYWSPQVRIWRMPYPCFCVPCTLAWSGVACMPVEALLCAHGCCMLSYMCAMACLSCVNMSCSLTLCKRCLHVACSHHATCLG